MLPSLHINGSDVNLSLINKVFCLEQKFREEETCDSKIENHYIMHESESPGQFKDKLDLIIRMIYL